MCFAVRFALFAIPLVGLACVAPESWRKHNRLFILGVFLYAGLIFWW